MRAAPAKFLFDQDFSDPRGRSDTVNAAEVAARVAEAEARGARAGYAAGQADANADTARRHALALEQIAGAVTQIAGRIGEIEARIEAEALDVALAASRKLCDELTAREPLAQTMALVKDCLKELVATPHIVVRVNEALYEAARTAMERAAAQSGFEGRLVILAEPDIATGDCRIEWADGGIVSERAATERAIAELVERHIGARNGAPGGAGTSSYGTDQR
jgi:flagellar assembly protein FliH